MQEESEVREYRQWADLGKSNAFLFLSIRADFKLEVAASASIPFLDTEMWP